MWPSAYGLVADRASMA